MHFTKETYLLGGQLNGADALIQLYQNRKGEVVFNHVGGQRPISNQDLVRTNHFAGAFLDKIVLFAGEGVSRPGTSGRSLLNDLVFVIPGQNTSIKPVFGEYL